MKLPELKKPDWTDIISGIIFFALTGIIIREGGMPAYGHFTDYGSASLIVAALFFFTGLFFIFSKTIFNTPGRKSKISEKQTEKKHQKNN